MQVEADQVANRVVVLGAIEAADARRARRRGRRRRARVEPGIDGLELVRASGEALPPAACSRIADCRPCGQQRVISVSGIGSPVAEDIQDDATLGRGAVVAAANSTCSSRGAMSLRINRRRCGEDILVAIDVAQA